MISDQSSSGKSQKAMREARVADALRENLRKRKAQQTAKLMMSDPQAEENAACP